MSIVESRIPAPLGRGGSKTKTPVKLRLDQGLCIRCGLEPLVNKWYGAKCREVSRADNLARSRKRRGIPADAPKFAHTRNTPAPVVSRQMELQRRHAKAGLCVRCKQPSVDGTQQCAKHLEITRALSLRNSRIKAGIPLGTPKSVRLPARLKNPTT